MKCLKRKLKKPMELYLHSNSNVISMNYSNTIIANDMEKSKLGEASFYENDVFSPPCTEEKIYFDDTIPPIYDDYNDEYDIFSPPTIEEKIIYGITICLLYLMTIVMRIIMIAILLKISSHYD
jgi:hypothetical protein